MWKDHNNVIGKARGFVDSDVIRKVSASILGEEAPTPTHERRFI